MQSTLRPRPRSTLPQMVRAALSMPNGSTPKYAVDSHALSICVSLKRCSNSQATKSRRKSFRIDCSLRSCISSVVERLCDTGIPDIRSELLTMPQPRANVRHGVRRSFQVSENNDAATVRSAMFSGLGSAEVGRAPARSARAITEAPSIQKLATTTTTTAKITNSKSRPIRSAIFIGTI